MHHRQPVEKSDSVTDVGTMGVSDCVTDIRVAVNYQGQSCVANTSETKSEEPTANHGENPVHALIQVSFDEVTRKIDVI